MKKNNSIIFNEHRKKKLDNINKRSQKNFQKLNLSIKNKSLIQTKLDPNINFNEYKNRKNESIKNIQS